MVVVAQQNSKEVSPSLGAPCALRQLHARIKIVQHILPQAGCVDPQFLSKIEKGKVRLPQYATEWSVVPNERASPKALGGNYNVVVVRMLAVVKDVYNGRFYNHREREVRDKRMFRRSVRTQVFFERMRQLQDNAGLLLIPTQFGEWYRGCSSSSVCERTMRTPELPADTLTVASVLIAHQELCVHGDDPWLSCAGDESDDPRSSIRFDRTPYFFRYGNDELEFGTQHKSIPRSCCTTPTSFLV